jgi:hypothetical protein
MTASAVNLLTITMILPCFQPPLRHTGGRIHRIARSERVQYRICAAEWRRSALSEQAVTSRMATMRWQTEVEALENP